MSNQHTKNHDIKTLPKWAQDKFSDLRFELEKAQKKLSTIEDMNAIMCEPKRDWFTLPFYFKDYDYVHLWLLNHDHPISVCSLGKGDLLFVGRAKKENE